MSDKYMVAYNTWQEKTDWVQTDKRFDVLLPWGKHRADVLKEYIERLESQVLYMAVQLANAESKCRELAAENENARNAVQVFCDVVGANTDAICEEVGRDGVRAILAAMNATGNMPATDAFLAEVRAQGVEMFADDLLCPDLDSTIREFAYQLRKGAAL